MPVSTPPPSPPSPPAKRPIDLHSALLSTLRTWLVFRDNALWTFCAGTDATQVAIETVKVEDCQSAVTEMNRLCSLILNLAEQIKVSQVAGEGGGVDEKSVRSILRSAIDELLASENPRFLLSIPHLPGSF